MDKVKAAMGGAPWQVGVTRTTLANRTLRTLFLHWVQGPSLTPGQVMLPAIIANLFLSCSEHGKPFLLRFCCSA